MCLDEELYDLIKSKLLSLGGIGSINTYNNKIIFKLTFNVVAYINNIKMYTKLKQLNIPCTKLLKYNLIKYNSNLFKLFPNCLEYLKLKAEYNNMDFVYILKYEKYNGNVYGLVSSIPFTIQSIFNNSLDIKYFKIWIYFIIFKLLENKLYHNDLKLDNILFNITNQSSSIQYIDNIILNNKSNYNYYLNDFDLSIDKQINSDIFTLLNSMIKLNLLNDIELEYISKYNNDVILYHLLNYHLSNESIRELIYINIINE